MLMSYLVVIWAVLVAKSSSFDQCQGEYCPSFLKSPQPLFGTPSDADTVFLGQDPKTGCICRALPGIVTVCFGRNTCTSLPIRLFNISSPMLRICETMVDTLKPGDFRKVQHLRDLQLEGNSQLTTILPGTFENMSNLLNLSISYNTNLNSLHPKCFEGLVNLQHLYLNKNGFQSLSVITPSLSVDKLPNLFRLAADSNNFSNVGEHDFEPMKDGKLNELSLGLCRIENINSKALLPLRNLEHLQLPENRIGSDVLADLLNRTFERKINLKILNFAWINTNVVPKKLLEVIAESNVTILNLAKNHFEELTKDSFSYLPKIEVLDLRSVLLLSITDDAFESLPNLEILLLSSNKLVNVPHGVLRPSLTHLDLQENSDGPLFSSYFMLKAEQFCNMTNLIYLNLAYNTIPHLFNTSFIGLDNLKTLVLRNLSLFHAQKSTFVPLKNLEYLDLNFNVISHRRAVPDIFFSLEKLKVLMLTGCQFRYISADLNPFRNLKSLQRLELGRNSFTALSPGDFKPLVSLKFIDLRKNYLTYWNERLFSSNNLLKTIIIDKNKISLLNSAMLQDFLNATTVNMDLNGFLCACFVASAALEGVKTNVSVLQTIFKPNVLCTYPEELSNITVSQYYADVQNGKIICKTKLNLLPYLPVIFVLAILLLILALGCYFRWQIKYFLFLTKMYLSRKGKIKRKSEIKGHDNYLYDAFVSYCSEDTNFVLKVGTVLENFPPYFKLCVYDRDFLGGVCISDAILVSIERSRKTVLIVSDSYAKSHWCRWESHIAEHHRIHMRKGNGTFFDDTLILIKIGEINKSHMTPLLRYLLKTRVYLEWQEEEHKQKVFWEKLTNALGPPLINKEVTKM